MVALPAVFSLEPRLKEQFAGLLLRGFTPFIAAIQLFPDDAATANDVSKLWPDDPHVMRCIAAVRAAEQAAAEPPTKLAQIKRIETRLAAMKADDFLKAERLIAEMSGHLERPAPPSVTIQNNNSQQVIERVLVVKDHGTDAEWEEKARAQQAKLVGANA